MDICVKKGVSKDGKDYLSLVVNGVIVTFDSKTIMRVYDLRYSDLQKWYRLPAGIIEESKGE